MRYAAALPALIGLAVSQAVDIDAVRDAAAAQLSGPSSAIPSEAYQHDSINERAPFDANATPSSRISSRDCGCGNQGCDCKAPTCGGKCGVNRVTSILLPRSTEAPDVDSGVNRVTSILLPRSTEAPDVDGETMASPALVHRAAAAKDCLTLGEPFVLDDGSIMDKIRFCQIFNEFKDSEEGGEKGCDAEDYFDKLDDKGDKEWKVASACVSDYVNSIYTASLQMTAAPEPTHVAGQPLWYGNHECMASPFLKYELQDGSTISKADFCKIFDSFKASRAGKACDAEDYFAKFDDRDSEEWKEASACVADHFNHVYNASYKPSPSSTPAATAFKRDSGSTEMKDPEDSEDFEDYIESVVEKVSLLIEKYKDAMSSPASAEAGSTGSPVTASPLITSNAMSPRNTPRSVDSDAFFTYVSLAFAALSRNDEDDSNGSKKPTEPAVLAGWAGPKPLKGAYGGDMTLDLFNVTHYFPSSKVDPVDASVCATQCEVETLNNRVEAINENAIRIALDSDDLLTSYRPCNAFNVYTVSVNGIVDGIHCSLWSSAPAPDDTPIEVMGGNNTVTGSWLYMRRWYDVGRVPKNCTGEFCPTQAR